jgi:G3E family GTPase
MLLDSGCLCCLDTGALHETLSDLFAQRARGTIPRFERVVIETSGAADPAPLINTLLGHPLIRSHFRLVATVTTVDAQHFAANLGETPEVARQVALADRLVLTRSDLADPPSSEAARAQARSINGDAAWWSSTPESPALSVFDDDGETAGLRIAASTPHPVATPLFTPHPMAPLHALERRIRSHTVRPPESITWAAWAAWSRLLLQRMGDRLLRVKGLLRLADTGEVVCVQIVQRVVHRPLRLPDWPSPDQSNRLVVIGIDLGEDDIAATFPAFEIEPGTPTDALAPHPKF